MGTGKVTGGGSEVHICLCSGITFVLSKVITPGSIQRTLCSTGEQIGWQNASKSLNSCIISLAPGKIHYFVLVLFFK